MFRPAIFLTALSGLTSFAALPARAQPPAPGVPDVRPRSALAPSRLPPLPDSLRLYGGTLPVRIDLPMLAPPPGAPRVTLSEAIATALTRNPDRLAALLDAERARREAVPEAAGFAPTLDAGADLGGSASVPLSRRNPASGGEASSGARARRSSSVGADLTAGYTLLDGFRRDATLRRLRATARSAALDADVAAEALAFAVVDAYVEAVRQQRLAGAREEAVAVSTDRLRIEQARVRIGVAAEIEAALALADLNSDRAALLRQRLSARAARIRVGRLLALDDPDALVLADPLPGAGGAPDPAPGTEPALGGVLPGDGTGDAADRPAASVAALAREAEATSRDVRALEAREVAFREAIREVEAERFPTVRATAAATFGVTDAGVLPLLAPELAPGLRYGLSASLPLFDAGSRRRRLAAARDRATQARLATDAARLDVRADLSLLAGQESGYRQLLALEEANVAVARQNVRVALAQQELGLISALDLRQIQLSLVDAETRRIDALAALVLTDAEIRTRAGRLLPPDAALAD